MSDTPSRGADRARGLVLQPARMPCAGRVLGAQNAVMLAAPAVTSAPPAAVAATAGLPVAGAVLAGLAGVTAIAALAAPAVRSLDDPRAERRTPSPHVAVGAEGPGPHFLDVAPGKSQGDLRRSRSSVGVGAPSPNGAGNRSGVSRRSPS